METLLKQKSLDTYDLAELATQYGGIKWEAWDILRTLVRNNSVRPDGRPTRLTEICPMKDDSFPTYERLSKLLTKADLIERVGYKEKQYLIKNEELVEALVKDPGLDDFL